MNIKDVILDMVFYVMSVFYLMDEVIFTLTLAYEDYFSNKILLHYEVEYLSSNVYFTSPNTDGTD